MISESCARERKERNVEGDSCWATSSLEVRPKRSSIGERGDVASISVRDLTVTVRRSGPRIGTRRSDPVYLSEGCHAVCLSDGTSIALGI